jgi:hypothetical protein
MHVINWLDLQPLPADLDALTARIQEALPLRKVCELLVEVILRAYPWQRRADLISCYDPSQTYKQGQHFALFIPDLQNARRIVWLLAQVKNARMVENPLQGRFQVLTLGAHGRQVQMASGIPGASYPEPDLSNYTSAELAWLVEWVSATYAGPLQATLRKLIQNGQIRGRLVGQTFLPEHVSALSVERLHPYFARLSPARPWLDLVEIINGLPDLAQLERGTALGLLHATLKEGSYRSLGGERWTTPALFDQLNRDVPRGLSTPRLRSKVHSWTRQDQQDLAGYGRKIMPPEARNTLEELENGEHLPEANDSAWHPPITPVRLPTLNYLHITQAYCPVGYVLGAFASDVQVVFVQFINGPHQPFLLDRENGLLKAVHPGELRSKILGDGIPAGTTLWLEYEGSEKYRIAPRRLPFKRMVPCKLVHLEDGHLRIEHTQISMRYQGNPALFKADVRSDEMEALLAAASQMNLPVRDAMIDAMQEICATDPNHRAHWSDLFNAVFLRRMCSPGTVSFLLYTQPCFVPLGGGYFRYQPAPVAPVMNTPKRPDRLAQLWEGLLSNPVLPEPLASGRVTVRARLEVRTPFSSPSAPDQGYSSPLSQPEMEPEISVAAFPFVTVEEKHMESIPLSNYEPDRFTARTEAAVLISDDGRDPPGELSYRQGKLENAETSALSLSAGETTSESEAPAYVPFEDAHAEFSFFSPTLGLKPRPAWVNTPLQPRPPAIDTTDTRRYVYRPRIPVRPLHKQPFYRRVFYYLRGWLSRIFRKAT